MDRFLTLITAPFFVTYLLSGYRPGTSSTPNQRLIMVLWMVFGQVFAYIGLTNYQSPVDMWRWPRTIYDYGYLVFFGIVSLVPGAGFGTAYVMLREFGDCISTY